MPFFCKIVLLENQSLDFQFALENTVFEEFDNEKLSDCSLEFPEDAGLEINRYKSDNTGLIEIRIPAVIRKNDRL